MPPTHHRLELILRACAYANLAALVVLAGAIGTPAGQVLLGSAWVWLGAHGFCRLALGQIRGLLSVVLAAATLLLLLHPEPGALVQGVAGSPSGLLLLGMTAVLGVIDALQGARAALDRPLGHLRPSRPAHRDFLLSLGQAGALGGGFARAALGILILIGIFAGTDALEPVQIARIGLGALLAGGIAAGLLARAAHLLALGAYRQVPPPLSA